MHFILQSGCIIIVKLMWHGLGASILLMLVDCLMIFADCMLSLSYNYCYYKLMMNTFKLSS